MVIVSAGGDPGLGQELPGRLEVGLLRRTLLGEVPGRKVALRQRAAPAHHVLDHLLVGEGQAHRLPHARVVERRLLRVHPEELDAPRGLGGHHEVLALGEALQVARGDRVGPVALAALHQDLLRRRLRHQLEDHPVQVLGRPAAPVAVEAVHHDLLADLELPEPERPGPCLVLGEPGLGEVVTLLVLLHRLGADDEDDRQAQEERRVGPGEHQLHGHRVDDADLLHRIEGPRAAEPDLLHPLQRELHVLGAEGGAVVELHVLAQGERVRQPVGRDLPALGQDSFEVGRVGGAELVVDQRLVHASVDLPRGVVRPHGRIDVPGLVAGQDQEHAVLGRRRPGCGQEPRGRAQEDDQHRATHPSHQRPPLRFVCDRPGRPRAGLEPPGPRDQRPLPARIDRRRASVAAASTARPAGSRTIP